MSDNASPYDLHLKPLDNDALLRPLRKPPTPAAGAKPAAGTRPAAGITPAAGQPPAASQAPVARTAPMADALPAMQLSPAANAALSQMVSAAPGAAASARPAGEQERILEMMKAILSTAISATPAQQEALPDPDALRARLILLQQKIREAKIPVVIVIEGLSTAGKGTMLSRLIEGLDSRGYRAYPIRPRNCVEQAYPAMWRYWTNMPSRGNISLFCSSWYGELNKAALAHHGGAPAERLQEIIDMENQLLCDGTLVLKFFLYITRQEQAERLKRLERKKSTAWLVNAHDLDQNRRYDEYTAHMDGLMAATNFKDAPWHVLDAADLRDCALQMYQTVIEAFENALAVRAKNIAPWDVPMLPNLAPLPSLGFPPLRSIPLDRHLNEPYREALKALKKRLDRLQTRLYRKGVPMVICFEGWDAAGKGGAIRRLNEALDARGFTVTPISAPTPTELSHHYLWRFWSALPPKGHITIFDRTWYGRVMVERVEALCTQPQWQRAYDEINRFEKLLIDDGAILCKFWLQIDSNTQLARFEARKADPEKQWKLTDEDWRNRDKWPAYEDAVNEMLQRTHTACAPWTVVEANDKEFARIKVLQTVADAMEKRLLGSDDDED